MLHIEIAVTTPKLPKDFPWVDFTQSLKDRVKAVFSSAFKARNAAWNDICVKVSDWDPRSAHGADVEVVITITHPGRPFISDSLDDGRMQKLVDAISGWFGQWARLKSRRCSVIYRENIGDAFLIHS